MNAHPVTFPLVNTNEPEALLVELAVKEGQEVSEGDLLCTLETTKSTQELFAEAAGFVIGLQYHPGDTVRAGKLLCYLAESLDWQLPDSVQKPTQAPTLDDTPANLRITHPALHLAREKGIDLDGLPRDTLITESILRSYLNKPEAPAERGGASLALPFDPTAVVVYGGGGHGKSIIDLLRALRSFRLVGVVDDGLEKGSLLMGVPVLGGAEVLESLYNQGIRLAVNAVGGIGNLEARMKIFELLHQAGFTCPTVIHPNAYVEPSASLEAGVQIFPFAYLGSDTRVGFGSIINTAAIVSHDCLIGAYANLSPGATLAGGVKIGDRVLVGMRSTINLLAEIGEGARIGNGATVKNSVPPAGIVPAGAIWPFPHKPRERSRDA